MVLGIKIMERNVEKSGGVTSNIGIHFFDLLIHIFGGALKSSVNLLTLKKHQVSLSRMPELVGFLHR